MKGIEHQDLLILIGEKGGLQARDNGFCYFQHRMKSGFKNTFFIYSKQNVDIEKLLPFNKNIILKDSKKHHKIFYDADYLLLNDGYLDTFPSFNKKPLEKGWAPIVYLQHGIISYKRIFIFKGHYNGRIRYFSTSLKSEKNIVINTLQTQKDINQTKRLAIKYKIPHYDYFFSRSNLEDFYILLLQRYYVNKNSVEVDDLQALKKLILNIGFLDKRVINSGLSRHELLPMKKKNEKNILFFFTWREEWTKPGDDNPFLDIVQQIKNSQGIIDYANKRNLNIAFYLHEKILHLKPMIEKLFDGAISFVGHDDFSAVLKDTAVCITDYSSIAFEFNLIKTPVIFLQFDYDNYKFERGHFLKSPYEFNGSVVRTIDELEDLFSDKSIDFKIKHRARKDFLKVIRDYENFNKTNKFLDNVIADKQQHIVYCCYNIYGVGGTVQTVINQANYLVSVGYQVSIISMRRTSDTPKLQLDPSVRIEYLNDARSNGKFRTKMDSHLAQYSSKIFKKSEDLYNGLSLLTDFKLVSILKTIKNATIIGTFPGLCVNIIKHAHKSNKVIVQEHREFSSHSIEIQKTLLRNYPKAYKVLTLTSFQKEEYNAQGISKVTPIPNGLEDKFPLISQSGRDIQKKRIVSFGRLVELKQFNLLIESFAKIAKKFPDWILDIFGDGDEKENLINQIATLGLTSQVTIHPPTSLVYEEIYNSAFCALTSAKEAFGMVYIESFSMSKPVVSYDIGYGPKDFLVNEYNALVSPCFDTQHFAMNMERLMADENLLIQLGENSRKTYLEKYEISKVMDKLLKECE